MWRLEKKQHVVGDESACAAARQHGEIINPSWGYYWALVLTGSKFASCPSFITPRVLKMCTDSRKRARDAHFGLTFIKVFMTNSKETKTDDWLQTARVKTHLYNWFSVLTQCLFVGNKPVKAGNKPVEDGKWPETQYGILIVRPWFHRLCGTGSTNQNFFLSSRILQPLIQAASLLYGNFWCSALTIIFIILNINRSLFCGLKLKYSLL